jgi:tRNA(Arg) A34 adenosine deaminase TadA
MDETTSESAEQNNTQGFGECGLIVSMQKLNEGAPACRSHNMINCGMAMSASVGPHGILMDEERMREIIEFTARTLKTARPVPFGALIVNTRTGKRLMRATNAVLRESDPSAHAETRAVRLACKKLKRPSLAGFTMYSTCEPCPMCMANALWARLDRVVFGATIKDANRYCLQIHIGAKEVAQRSDMPCIVNGPVLRGLSNKLFTHPNMQKAFRSWSTSKSYSVKSRIST